MVAPGAPQKPSHDVVRSPKTTSADRLRVENLHRSQSTGHSPQNSCRPARKHVTPEKFSDRIIFMSMFNDIELERKDNEDSCATTPRKIKEHASNSNDGHWHSWEPEKKASGIKDMQPIMVASGIFVRHKWWKNLRIQDIRIPGGSPLGLGILKKNNRDTIHFNGEYGNINLLYRTVHSANQLCIYGAVSKWCGPNFGEASQSRPESARKMSPEILTKKGRSQVIG